MSKDNILVKGWCPSLEKPMETGDGLLVRLPLKFGRLSAEIARDIAELSKTYGNGHLDLSTRGNLQFRGVSEASYIELRSELKKLGFERDSRLAIITNPLAKDMQKIAEELEESYIYNEHLPEKYLIVIDGGGVFPLTDIPCDLYIPLTPSSPAGEGGGGASLVKSIISKLSTATKCNKKPASEEKINQQLGFVPLAEKTGIVIAICEFGRLEAEQLAKLADIAQRLGSGEIVLAPKRMIILPNINKLDAEAVVSYIEKVGLIVNNADARKNIYACVGSPACSSAFGETRQFAKKYAIEHPNLDKIVHITGCPKGCAYKGKADITIDLSTNL